MKFLLEAGIDPKRFERIGEACPKVLLDHHPDGRHVALRADYVSSFQPAGVWDVSSGRMVWLPEGATLLCWSAGGREVLLLTERYERDPNRPAIAASNLQSEFSYTLERRSWPARELIGTCPISFPTGWPNEMAGSPAGDLATVTWLEQDCAGFVFVRLDARGARQLGDPGGYYVEPNLIQGPVFAPDGKCLAATCTLWSWWAPDGDPETPSPGGRMKVGHLVIYDTRSLTPREIPITAEVAQGWLPPNTPVGAREMMMDEPRFLEGHAIRVTLPTGGTQDVPATDPLTPGT